MVQNMYMYTYVKNIATMQANGTPLINEDDMYIREPLLLHFYFIIADVANTSKKRVRGGGAQTVPIAEKEEYINFMKDRPGQGKCLFLLLLC